MNINRRSVMQLMGGASAAAMLPAATMRGARAATGTVVVAIEEAPKQLDPLRYLTNPGYRTIYNIFDTLIGVDYRANGKLIPGLATSWRRINDRTVEVKLRENVSFHDGTKMTADDVVFSFSAERINTKGTPGDRKSTRLNSSHSQQSRMPSSA